MEKARLKTPEELKNISNTILSHTENPNLVSNVIKYSRSLKQEEKLRKRKIKITPPHEINSNSPHILRRILAHYRNDVPIGEIARRMSTNYKTSHISILECYLVLYKAMADKTLTPKLIQRRKYLDKNEIRVAAFPKLYDLWIKGASPREIHTFLPTERQVAINTVLQAFRNRSRGIVTSQRAMELEDLLLCFQQADRVTINNVDGIFIPLTAVPMDILANITEPLQNTEVTEQSAEEFERTIEEINKEVHIKKDPKTLLSQKTKTLAPRQRLPKDHDETTKQEIEEQDAETLHQIEENEDIQFPVENDTAEDTIEASSSEVLSDEQKDTKISELFN